MGTRRVLSFQCGRSGRTTPAESNVIRKRVSGFEGSARRGVLDPFKVPQRGELARICMCYQGAGVPPMGGEGEIAVARDGRVGHDVGRWTSLDESAGSDLKVHNVQSAFTFQPVETSSAYTNTWGFKRALPTREGDDGVGLHGRRRRSRQRCIACGEVGRCKQRP